MGMNCLCRLDNIKQNAILLHWGEGGGGRGGGWGSEYFAFVNKIARGAGIYNRQKQYKNKSQRPLMTLMGNQEQHVLTLSIEVEIINRSKSRYASYFINRKYSQTF